MGSQGVVAPVDLYAHPDLYDALHPVREHLAFYRDLIQQSHGPVLELGCGSGLLTVPLADTRGPVVGLDSSAAMLEKARCRADAAGVQAGFIEADMRRFSLPQRFGLIFIARNTLLHLLSLGDLIDTLATIRRHLLPGGIVAFDIFNPNPEVLARTPDRRFPVMSVDTDAFGRLSVEVSHRYAPPVVHGTWYISDEHTIDRWVAPLVVRCLFPHELPSVLAAAGLELHERFGMLDRTAFAIDSPLQVCVCRARLDAAD